MTHRRNVLALLASVIALPALRRPAHAEDAPRSRITAYAFSFRMLDGGTVRLAEHSGKPILVVNTASLCGYTPQYAGLQQLWTRYRERGLLVLGVPSNDFGGQEPGEAAEIGHTAHTYNVGFPIAEKVAVRGANAHPFYRWAAATRPLDQPRWNFHKYLVGRDGRLAAAFPSAVDPADPRVVAAIEKELSG